MTVETETGDGVTPMQNVLAFTAFAIAITLTVASVVEAAVAIKQIGQFSITANGKTGNEGLPVRL